ncbi:arginyl-tRNA synthetase [Uncinocarpus reesii 1704]|uniref:arginine--tRNA ligase n=1 Tax=Uncinocarpus reesii (strain UAMH 1704) TaxID=336963 RepID=C4JXH9_UNCRE|nr:arginyl-tRNA synthetase [Uncinocarpus reesii 1704]EEP81487.1 arginyl-tRNA synthetase [Uncinocarpus reesii 1704]
MAADSVIPAVAELSVHDTTSEVSKYPNCYPTLNPVDKYRAHIAELVGPIVGKEPEFVYTRLQWTNTLEKGDLLLAVPALQIKGKKPADLAGEIAANFPESDLVEPPVAMGTHLQFHFRAQPLIKTVIPSILKNKATYGTNANIGLRDPRDPSQGKKRIVVEFSSPNIAKPFHAGHLRSTIIGGFPGEFAHSLWDGNMAYWPNGYKMYGNEEELLKDPINHLFEVYVKINKDVAEQEGPIKDLKERIKVIKDKGEDAAALEKELDTLVAASWDEKARQYFRSMEDGDEDALALWRRFRDLSITKYRQTYARLNIDFDVYSGESQVKQESLSTVYNTMQEKGVSEDSEGAIIVDFTKHGAKKLGKAIVVRKDGTPLYLTRDIAAIFERETAFNFDKMLYVVAAQQDLHLAQLFKTVELMGRKDLADKCQHINFGMVRGMSTRKGTVKFLNDILKDVGDKMHEVMRKNAVKYEQVENPVETADTLGITSVMVQDMSGKRINGYEFNLEDMTSFEGDTGPYLQYAHARLCSVTRKAEIDPAVLGSADLSLLTESHAVDLARLLSQWPDVVLNAMKTLEPTTIITYLFRMTHTLSSGYETLKVVGSEPELKKARMALYHCARQVLNNGMRLLGLNPVESFLSQNVIFLIFTHIWLRLPGVIDPSRKTNSVHYPVDYDGVPLLKKGIRYKQEYTVIFLTLNLHHP